MTVNTLFRSRLQDYPTACKTPYIPFFSLLLLFQRCLISRVCNKGRCCIYTWEEITSIPKVAVTQALSSHLHWTSVQLLPGCSGTTTLEAATLLNVYLPWVLALLMPRGTLFLPSQPPVSTSAVSTSSWTAHEHVSPGKTARWHPLPPCLTSGVWHSIRALEMSVMTLVQCHLNVEHVLSLEQTLGARRVLQQSRMSTNTK